MEIFFGVISTIAGVIGIWTWLKTRKIKPMQEKTTEEREIEEDIARLRTVREQIIRHPRSEETIRVNEEIRKLWLNKKRPYKYNSVRTQYPRCDLIDTEADF